MELFLFPSDTFVEQGQEVSSGCVTFGFAEPVEHILRSRIGQNSTILDASACGGCHLLDLLRLGGNVYVCEPLRKDLSIPMAVRERIHSVSCKLNRLPFMDGAFDLVLLSNFYETPPEALNEIFRILKPQGLLLGTIFAPANPEDGSSNGPAGIEPDGDYYRTVAERTATSLLEVSGFSVIHREFQLAPIPERVFLAQKAN